MHHTYLMEKGEWTVRGMLVDASGCESVVSGTSTVEHGNVFWAISGLMEVHGAQTSVYSNSYVISPFSQGASQTEWQSENSKLGHFSGSYILVKDSILSTGQSGDGSHVISEWLQQIDCDRYINRGVLLKDGVRQSSWALELEHCRS